MVRKPSTEQVAMQSKIHHSIIHSISLSKLTSERQINSERQWRGSTTGFISLFDLHNPKNTRAGGGSEGRETDGNVKREGEKGARDKETDGKLNRGKNERD